MENVVKKVCLDTDFCISLMKNRKEAVEVLKKIEDFEIYITSITMFELLLRKTNLHISKRFVNNFTVISFKEKEAVKASSIYKELEKNGELIDMRDVFIASICIANDLQLLTYNKKHFERINELELFKNNC